MKNKHFFFFFGFVIEHLAIPTGLVFGNNFYTRAIGTNFLIKKKKSFKFKYYTIQIIAKCFENRERFGAKFDLPESVKKKKILRILKNVLKTVSIRRNNM